MTQPATYTSRLWLILGSTVLLWLASVTPAFAAVPTVDSFSPTSGIVGDAVVLTGTGFTGATNVTFNGTEAVFTFDSDTQISTSVPLGTTTGPIAVTTPDGTGTSATDFVVIVRPTIAGFDPTAGPAGTIVTVTGTGFTGVTSVTFNDVPSPDFTVVSDTELTTEVPSGAGTGPIRLTNAAGTRRSDQDFKFQKIEHRTTATLKLSKHLVAEGQVRVPDGFRRCRVHRTVIIQRMDSDPTRPKVRKGETRRDGSYRIKLPDREGRYRAFIKRMQLTDDICEPAFSDRKTHEHRTSGGGGGGGGGGNCDPSYPTVCIPPPPPDLDCPDIPYRNFTVRGDDPHGFDGDNDGVGCET